LNVGATPDAVAKVGAAERTIRSVFASYASENRFDVLQWARGAELVGVDVFIDVLKFREAADWATELLHQVPTRDAFCLFWSEPARRSTWVEREWRCALSTRGVDYIHPVPLVDPRILPPPMELEGKHFGGTTFLIQMYEQRLKADRAQT
jgi:TIR domain-containing protein